MPPKRKNKAATKPGRVTSHPKSQRKYTPLHSLSSYSHVLLVTRTANPAWQPRQAQSGLARIWPILRSTICAQLSATECRQILVRRQTIWILYNNTKLSMQKKTVLSLGPSLILLLPLFTSGDGLLMIRV